MLFSINILLLWAAANRFVESENRYEKTGMRGTALCAAIEARNINITKYLISAGCDVNAQDFDGEPPLLLALRKDCPGQILGKKPALYIAKLLIENKKCNVNKVDPLTKKSTLHFVSEQGMTDVVEWLMCAPYECNVNAVDKNGNSALHLARILLDKRGNY